MRAEVARKDAVSVRIWVSAITVVCVIATAFTVGASPSWADAGFGVEAFENKAVANETGTELATQAGSHPYAMTTNISLNYYEVFKEGIEQKFPEGGDLKGIEVNLPDGLIVNPDATPQRCTEAELERVAGAAECPIDSAVGVIEVHTSSFPNVKAAVYNMTPPSDAPGMLGFNLTGLGFIANIVGSVRTGGDYGVSATASNITQKFGVTGASITLWGDPESASHDSERGKCAYRDKEQREGEEKRYKEEVKEALEKGKPLPKEEEYDFRCPASYTGAPLLTMPTSCGEGSPIADVRVASWLMELGEWTPLTSSSPTMPAVAGCGALAFSPSLTVGPESSVSAESPTGLEVDLKIPQEESVEGLAESDLKEALVTLPAGMTVSPSAANGLGVCTEAEIGLNNANEPSCSKESKLGTVEIETPLLREPLHGSVFLAQQGNLSGHGSNPFGSLFALYLVAEGSGVLVKLPGEVRLNQATGQVSARFGKDPATGFYLPQLPFSDLKIHLFGGQDAPLVTPSSCGAYTATSQLVPWDGNPAVEWSSGFSIGQGCATGGFAPSFSAGTINNQTGGYSPFSLTFSRRDGEQRFSSVQATMPEGLLGKIAGVAQCSEPQAAKGECSEASLLGEATTAVGPGEDPYWVTGGKVYLTGPYNGGSFGLSIVVPTTAGPFTLTGNGGPGKEVVRAAIHVNPNTAQITVLSDPLPTILEGVPLDIRTVNVTINRAGFMFNPTNCEASKIEGTIASTGGADVVVSSPFEAANCATLPFRPSFSASTEAKTSKANGASLVVKVAQNAGEANIHKVDLTLPKALPARLTTLQKACTEAQFNANPAGCPEASFIGVATAHTPVLNAPLTGPAILVSHGGAAFPDVEFLLQGEGVEIVLDGKTDIKGGITYSRFETVPDAPISSFETTLPEGPHSALTTEQPGSTNLCSPTRSVKVKERVTVRRKGRTRKVTRTVTKHVAEPLQMPTTLVGQNGAVLTQTTKIAVSRCPKATSAHKKAKKTKPKARAKQRSRTRK